MATSNNDGPNISRGEQAHLMSLVLKSEKALEQGQELCSIARTQSVESAQIAVDVLALDAKVRWMTDAVLEQLKVSRIPSPVATLIDVNHSS